MFTDVVGRVGAAAACAALLVAGHAATATAGIPGGPGTPGAAATINAGEVLLYSTDAQGAVWSDDVVGAAAPVRVGGRLVDGPAPIYDGHGQAIVFGRGTDDGLWTARRVRGPAPGEPEEWSGWTPLGGVLTSKPAAVFRGPEADAYSVFARGTDGALWQRDHGAGGWLPWQRVGGVMFHGTGPAVARLNNGETWVVVVGADLKLWALRLGSPGGFTSIGGQTTDTPALTAPFGTTLVAYARGFDGAVWSRELPPGTVGWHTLGGNVISGPAVTANQPPDVGAVYLFGYGTDGRLWWRHAIYPDYVWWQHVPVP